MYKKVKRMEENFSNMTDRSWEEVVSSRQNIIAYSSGDTMILVQDLQIGVTALIFLVS